MTHITLLFCLVFLSSCAYLDNPPYANFSGKVIDSQTRNPVEKANVSIFTNRTFFSLVPVDGHNVAGTITNTNGKFSLSAKTNFPTTMIIHKDGLINVTKLEESLDPNKNLIFELRPRSERVR